MKALQKPVVQVLLILVIAGFVGLGIYASKMKKGAPPTSTKEPASSELGETSPEKKPIAFGEVESKVVTGTKVEKMVVPPKPPPPAPVIMQAKPANDGKQAENQPKPVLPTLVHAENNSIEPVLRVETPEVFGPRGLIIKAVLVLTVDSSSLETPVLALVTEDVYWGGELLVPAGTQVFAKASEGKTRDRIEVVGEFTFVWADGREYKINGIALDHEMETETSFALTDGSAGIRGEEIDTLKNAGLKLLLAELVSGFVQNAQGRVQTVFGEQSQSSPGNGGLQGASGASERYAELLVGKIEEDMSYVRVPAGKEFYIFTEDVFEPDLASIAGVKQGNSARSSIEMQAESYQAQQARYQRDLEAVANLKLSPAQREEQARAAEREEYLKRVSNLVNDKPSVAE